MSQPRKHQSWYCIQVQIGVAHGNTPSPDDTYLSKNGRISRHPGMARLETRELAECYASAMHGRVEERYGVVSLVIIETEGRLTEAEIRRVIEDSEVVRLRIAQSCLAPNIQPT